MPDPQGVRKFVIVSSRQHLVLVQLTLRLNQGGILVAKANLAESQIPRPLQKAQFLPITS